MPEYGGFDVKLEHTNDDATVTTYHLKLIRDANGAPGFRITGGSEEPGTTGQATTILFDNFHHGIGGDVSIPTAAIAQWHAADTTRLCNGFSTMKPGRIESIGNLMEPLGDSAGPNITGPTETTRVFATSFQWQGKVFFILPKTVLMYEWSDPNWQIVATAAANQVFRGPAAFYQGFWIWGLENDDGLSIGHAFYDTEFDLVDVRTAGTQVKASLFHSVHTALWALQVTTVNPKKGAVGWKIKLCDEADPTPDANYIDQTLEIFHPFPTNIYAYGRWIVVFGADGQIVAFSETPPNKTLVPAGILATDDAEFGVGARQFGEFLLVPSRNGLHAIPFTDNRLRDFSPQAIQARLGREPVRPCALAPYGMNYLIGTRSAAASPYKTQILSLADYPDGVFYNEFVRAELLSTGAHVIRAMEAISTTGRVLILAGNATEGKIWLLGLPPAIGGRPPALLGGVPFLSPASAMHSSYSYAPSRGRCIFTQVRGWAEGVIGDPLKGAVEISVSVDNGAFQSIVVPRVPGPFIGNLNKQIGRTASLGVTGTVVEDNGTDWPVILTPIMLDVIEEPASGFRLQFDIMAGGGVRRMGARTDKMEDLAQALHDLEGLPNSKATIIESSVEYDVIVEEVQMQQRKAATGRERTEAIIRLVAKVL